MKLYHASPVKNLKILEPKRTISNDKYIGDFVFATRYRKLALMYMLPKGFPILMNIKSSKPYVVLCGNAEDILKKDTGGALYVLSTKSFSKTPQSGLSDYEMVSKKTVNPLNETDYKSTIKALASESIEIYFVDSNTFEKLIFNPEQDSMVKTLIKFKPQ